MSNRRKAFEFNFWPGVADMILATLMLFLILWFVERLFFLQHSVSAQCPAELKVCRLDLENVEQDLRRQIILQRTDYEQKLSKSEEQFKQASRCQVELERCQRRQFKMDKPPIITLEETKGYSFETGKATLSDSFKKLLTEQMPNLRKIFQDYGVDIVEIIGHTDGQPTNSVRSNLDEKLEDVMKGEQTSLETLKYGSNADLGLMRALAVALFLKNLGLPEGIKLRVYSAAQLILPDGSLSTEKDRVENPQRRRIELRFTRL